MNKVSFKICLLWTVLFPLLMGCQNSFINEQKKHERVQKAYEDSDYIIASTLEKANIKRENLNVLLVAYKAERKLEVFAKNQQDSMYKNICSYDVCTTSGVLGPKRQQGDKQIPEGFYHIVDFNPESNFLLSLGIDYPNESDRKKSDADNLGGDIYIHGNCVSIGCLPMTDDKIKEIYLYAIEARNNGQTEIPVYIFPFEMIDENNLKYTALNINNKELLNFWSNLRNGFAKFRKEKKALNFKVDNDGNYIFF